MGAGTRNVGVCFADVAVATWLKVVPSPDQMRRDEM